MEANPETPEEKTWEKMRYYNLDLSSQFPGPSTVSLNLLFKAAACLEISHGGIWMQIKNP